MLRHLFRSIDTVFWPNAATDVLRKDLISTKNLGQGDAAWPTKKTVLGWELNTKEHRLRLTPKCKIHVRAALDVIQAKVRQVSFRKCWHLLGLLRSITSAIARAQGMLARLQHALR